MEKGYYGFLWFYHVPFVGVAIHNKNGKGLLPYGEGEKYEERPVAIHNKNGKGLLLKRIFSRAETPYSRNPQ